MAQCSSPSSAEALLCMEGVRELWRVPHSPDRPGRTMKPAFLEKSAGGCAGIREVLRAQRRGLTEQGHRDLAVPPPGRETEGCSGARAVEVLVLYMHPQTRHQFWDRVPVWALGGGSCPLDTGQPAWAGAAGLRCAGAASSASCI